MAKNSSNPEIGKANSTQLQKASMALDDLVWTLQKIGINNLKEAAEALRSSLTRDLSASSVARTYKSGNPNKHFLIGVLPRLFQDKDLFPQNDDIADFAGTLLGLEMSRTEKRSRYEIIGKVVCETNLLDDPKLSVVVQALEKLVEDKGKLAQVAEKKRSGSFSWNETLQDILKA